MIDHCWLVDFPIKIGHSRFLLYYFYRTKNKMKMIARSKTFSHTFQNDDDFLSVASKAKLDIFVLWISSSSVILFLVLKLIYHMASLDSSWVHSMWICTENWLISIIIGAVCVPNRAVHLFLALPMLMRMALIRECSQ